MKSRIMEAILSWGAVGKQHSDVLQWDQALVYRRERWRCRPGRWHPLTGPLTDRIKASKTTGQPRKLQQGVRRLYYCRSLKVLSIKAA